MRQHSSDSNKSNSTVTTTIGNCIRDYDPISMAAPTAMRTPVAWQHREMNISRPSSSHRRSLSAPRNHQQQVVEHKKTAAATAAAVIAQLKSNNDSKNYCQQPFKQKNNVNKLNSWSSNSINNNAVMKQQNYQINKQLQQQQQFLRQQMLHRKKNNSSSPSVATTSSDDREEVPIVKHCRRIASSRTPNNPVTDRRTIINQLNRQNQMMAIPQPVMLPIASSMKQENSNGNCLPTSVFRNATLRSTRSIPALVLQQKKQQQMLYNKNADNFELDNCPVHGFNVINSINNHNQVQHYQSQFLPVQMTAQIMNNHNKNMLNLRKFASVNDIRKTAVNYIQTSNNQLMPAVFTVKNNNLPKIQTSLTQPINTASIATITNPNETKLSMNNNLLPMPIHPAVANVAPAPTIYTQPFTINNSRQPTSVLIPTFTTDSTPITIANKEQLIDLVNSNRDSCCRGHLIVLWIILSVIVIGIISGIILSVTMN